MKGILTQEIDDVLRSKLPPSHAANSSSYLAASYVQWVMSGGARVVPVIIGQQESYYRHLFSSINGLLLPGGNAPLTGPSLSAQEMQHWHGSCDQMTSTSRYKTVRTT